MTRTTSSVVRMETLHYYQYGRGGTVYRKLGVSSRTHTKVSFRMRFTDGRRLSCTLTGPITGDVKDCTFGLPLWLTVAAARECSVFPTITWCVGRFSAPGQYETVDAGVFSEYSTALLSDPGEVDLFLVL